jgi:hypothetical protein
MSLGIREYVLRGDDMIVRGDSHISVSPSVEEAKEKFLPQALPCPICKTSPEELSWVYLVIPEWACKDAEEREGWVTICDRCKLQVDFFIEKR